MQNSTAYLLVIHGSRDPRPALAVSELAQLFSARIRHAQTQTQIRIEPDNLTELPAGLEPRSRPAGLTLPEPVVGTASLECHPLRLHEQIVEFCQSQAEFPVRSLVILPLFLLPGVHVMEDIPHEIRLAQEIVSIEIQVRPHLGCLPKLRRLLNERLAHQSMAAWVLLSHGSRRAGANQPIADLADHLGAVPAYWSVPPNLETQLQSLSQLGLKKIGILPYFLFPGGITDAIAQSVSTLVAQYPDLDLHLDNPLQASSELADLLLDLAQN